MAGRLAIFCAVVHLASLHICTGVHGCASGLLMAVGDAIALQSLMRVQGLLAAQSLAGLSFVQAGAAAGCIGCVAHVLVGVALQC